VPTYARDESFYRDWQGLKREQKERFLAALEKFIKDADSGQIRGSLRVKPMEGHDGVWEMTWDGNDGRATFAFGIEQRPGKKHIIWRRIGTHAIFKNP
jgi:hypothetical protein